VGLLFFYVSLGGVPPFPLLFSMAGRGWKGLFSPPRLFRGPPFFFLRRFGGIGVDRVISLDSCFHPFSPPFAQIQQVQFSSSSLGIAEGADDIGSQFFPPHIISSAVYARVFFFFFTLAWKILQAPTFFKIGDCGESNPPFFFPLIQRAEMLVFSFF